MSRRFWARVHRYAGLTMALFLTVAGLTGCLLAFLSEIDATLNPHYHVDAVPGLLFDPLALREKILQRMPQAQVDTLPLHYESGEALHLWIELPVGDGSTGTETTDLVLNPKTGVEISRHNMDIWPITAENFMAFVYRLHYSLALGDFGRWLFGIAALVWTLDCFVGGYLTFPAPARSKSPITRRPWLARWSTSWKVKWRASSWRVNYDLHRAGSLWVWLALLVFAWSSVALNLGDQVYRPVMRLFFEMKSPTDDVKLLGERLAEPVLDWRTAHGVGQQLMAARAQEQGFRIMREQMLSYDSQRGVFLYSVLSDSDVNEKWGNTTVAFNAITGEFLAISLPTGQYAGNTITEWLVALHTAHLWGLPMQILICVTGLAVAVISVTGVTIWLKKQRARLLAKRLRQSRLW